LENLGHSAFGKISPQNTNFQKNTVYTCIHAEEVLGIYKKQQGKWISEQTWKKTEERNILQRKILNTTDTQKKEQLVIEYKDKDKQVKRSAR